MTGRENLEDEKGRKHRKMAKGDQMEKEPRSKRLEGEELINRKRGGNQRRIETIHSQGRKLKQ